MKDLPGAIVVVLVWLCTVSLAHGQTEIDTRKIDAALGRVGEWTEGVYMVNYPRPELSVVLQGVRLSDIQILSFATFVGSDGKAEMMGEVCALPEEVTPAVRKLRAAGIEVTGIHDHFIGESPRIVFIHFMATGAAEALAQGFRAALEVTGTALGKEAPDFSVGTPPDWAKGVLASFERTGGYYMPAPKTLEYDIPSTHFPATPMQDFWSNVVFFQPATAGKVAATGDIMVTAPELSRVLDILTRHGFQIMAVHNHMIDENPRVFFVHFWKIAAPEKVAEGLDSALTAAHARQR